MNIWGTGLRWFALARESLFKVVSALRGLRLGSTESRARRIAPLR